MKKQAISLALVLAMLVTTVLAAVPASAVNTTHTAHCACNDKAVDVGAHTECTVPENWTALTDANWADIANGGNFYLADNITAASRIDIEDGKAVTICLNGNTITTGNNKLFVVSEGVLNITDCKGTGVVNSKHVETATTASGPVFNIQGNAGVINVFGGTYNANTESEAVGKGGLGYIKDGVLNIYNGTLNGREAGNGGVLSLEGTSATSKGTVNMYGGLIDNGSAASGGNVYIYQYGQFNLYGGTVQNGESTENSTTVIGGNFFVTGTSGKNGRLDVHGGTIVNGEAVKRGGNIGVSTLGVVHLYGGVISGGTAGEKGADIYTGTSNFYIHNVDADVSIVVVSANGANTASGKVADPDASINVAVNSATINVTKKYVATSGTGTYGTLAEALAASDANNYVQLHANVKEDITLTKDAYLDLNGYDVNGTINLNGNKLYGMDSKTNDFVSADYGRIYSTITGGTPESNVRVALGNGKNMRYVAVQQGNSYSFHAIYIGVTDVKLVLDGDDVGMGYSTGFKADAVVAKKLNAFGIEVYVRGGDHQIGEKSGSEFVAGAEGNKTTAHITGILKDGTDVQHLATDVCAMTYLVVNGSPIYSNEYAFSLQDVFKAMADAPELPADAVALLAEIEGYYGDGFYNN